LHLHYQRGQNGSGTIDWIFKKENGNWLLYGDQRIGLFSATAESATFQGTIFGLGAGAISLGPDVFWQTGISAGVRWVPTGFGTENVTVSGEGNIWNGAGSATLGHSLFVQNGQTFDQFFALSQNLGDNVFNLTKKPFIFDVTTSTSGNPQYTVQ